MIDSLRIVVVGSIALDTIHTPWGSAEDCLGGSASYASLAVSYFSPAHLVAVVGTDLPASARDVFGQRGVDTEGLEVVAGKTFRWGGRYHSDMNRRDTLFTHLNVFEHFHPKLPASYRDCEIVLLANIHPALQIEVLDQVSQPRLVATDTMNLWIETAREDLLRCLRRTDLLFVNDEEARMLSGHSHLARAVAAIHAMGPRWIVVKKGEHGAVLFGEGRRFALPALVLEQVFDPTGAGDAFAGGMLGHIARRGAVDERSLQQGMIYGTVLASFVTERFGLDRLVELPERDIEHRVEELRELTRWPLD